MTSPRTGPSFESIFRSSFPARDKFLARLFGLFSEEVVRAWCSHPSATYENLGRPTLRGTSDGDRPDTIDFTFRCRESGRMYVGELKCELELENYRYLRLSSPEQIRHHHASRAFGRFLEASRNPAGARVFVKTKPVEIAGGILVWGATTPVGCELARKTYGFVDVLSIEAMLLDLAAWRPDAWTERMRGYRTWAMELFDFIDAHEEHASSVVEGDR